MLISSTTGLSPFEASLGYQPPLFPEEERDLEVPSVQHYLHWAQTVWSQTHKAFIHTADHNRCLADQHHVPAPQYAPGQHVWLATKTIPLKSIMKKLALKFIGRYEIHSIISPSAVRLKLPASMHIHPTFHVSLIKPLSSSLLCPPADPSDSHMIILGCVVSVWFLSLR